MILFLLVVLSISRVHQHFAILGQVRPALILFAIAVVYIALNPGQVEYRKLLRTWPAKTIIALGVLACLSAVFGISLGRSATYILDNYSKVVVFAFLLIAAIRHSRDLATFSWAFVIACGIMALLAFTVFDVVKEGPSQSYRLARFYSYDANDLSCVMLIGMPLSVVMFQVSSGVRRWVSGAVVLGIALTIARAGSRGSFVAIVAVGIYLLFSLHSVSLAKRVGFLGVVIVVLAFGAPEGYWAQMKTVFNPTEDYNWTATTGRKQLAIRGFGYMMSRPVFGIGIDNFPMAEGQLSSRARAFVPGNTGVRWAAAHNSYVQVGAELGVMGLALWLSLVFGGFWGAIRMRHRLPRQWVRGSKDERFMYLLAIYLPVAFLGFAVSAAFVSMAYLDPVYFLAVLLIGLYVSVDVRLRQMGVAPPAAQAVDFNGVRGFGSVASRLQVQRSDGRFLRGGKHR